MPKQEYKLGLNRIGPFGPEKCSSEITNETKFFFKSFAVLNGTKSIFELIQQ